MDPLPGGVLFVAFWAILILTGAAGTGDSLSCQLLSCSPAVWLQVRSDPPHGLLSVNIALLQMRPHGNCIWKANSHLPLGPCYKLVSEYDPQPEIEFGNFLVYPTTLSHGLSCSPAAGLDLSTAALEACLAESNTSLQQLQGHCDSLQARLNLMEAGHAADMEAMTEQLAEAAGSAAAKEAVTR